MTFASATTFWAGDTPRPMVKSFTIARFISDTLQAQPAQARCQTVSGSPPTLPVPSEYAITPPSRDSVQSFDRLGYLRPDAEAPGTWAAVGLRLPGYPSPPRVGTLVPSYRTVQGSRADRPAPRGDNPLTPGGASEIRARRSCPVRRQ